MLIGLVVLRLSTQSSPLCHLTQSTQSAAEMRGRASVPTSLSVLSALFYVVSNHTHTHTQAAQILTQTMHCAPWIHIQHAQSNILVLIPVTMQYLWLVFCKNTEYFTVRCLTERCIYPLTFIVFTFLVLGYSCRSVCMGAKLLIFQGCQTTLTQRHLA